MGIVMGLDDPSVNMWQTKQQFLVSRELYGEAVSMTDDYLVM